MEKKFNDNIYYYKLDGDEYKCGITYANFILSRDFNIDLIHKINKEHWLNISENNSKLIYKIIKEKVNSWIKIIKEDYIKYFQFEKGMCDTFKISLNLILELQILSEISGIFCTIICNETNFYRILDTSLFHRELLRNNLNEIHIIEINKKILFINPVYQLYHTLILETYSVAIFGNNLINKKTYLKNEIPFYLKIKIYLDQSNDESEFIEYINKDNEIFYDIEIIIKGKKYCHNIDVMNIKNNKCSTEIERSDYSPIVKNNFKNIHLSLKKFNRIFVLYIENNKIFINNSLVNDTFYLIK